MIPDVVRKPHVIERHSSMRVVREDLVPGGGKMRFLPYLVEGAEEIVFAGPFCGGAPYTLSELGKLTGQRVTLFYAKRKDLHPRQKRAKTNGAKLKFVTPGYMTVNQKRARDYAAKRGALFLPLGFDVPQAEEPFVSFMEGVRKKEGTPPQIWCATGSGMLARCLSRAFPEAEVVAVAVGLKSRWSNQVFPGNVRVLEAPYKFEQETKAACPYTSCPNYDRKAWEMSRGVAKPGAWHWNIL